MTLSHPSHLRFHCIDKNGRTAEAVVDVSHEGDEVGWVWHATFKGTGKPPAQLLGTSKALDDIRSDICSRLHLVTFREDSVGIIGPCNPSRTGFVSGPFTYPDGRLGRYRAERKSDGAIWTVEIINDDGDCLDSLEFPVDPNTMSLASTEHGALHVIAELLNHHYGAHVLT